MNTISLPKINFSEEETEYKSLILGGIEEEKDSEMIQNRINFEKSYNKNFFAVKKKNKFAKAFE